jgi:hypothetical protein
MSPPPPVRFGVYGTIVTSALAAVGAVGGIPSPVFPRCGWGSR